MTRLERASALLAACGLAVTGCAAPVAGPADEGGGIAMADCVMQLSYDGAVYEDAPKGPPDRRPLLTGLTDTAELPGCNDTGGEDEPSEQVTVEELEGVPMTTAVWSMGGVLVRLGESLPALAEGWYGVPGCSFDGTVDLVGRWLGVTSEKKVRFDGDLRPPLRIELFVQPGAGNPDELQRYTLKVHDDGAASPGLDKQMAEEALWSARSSLAVAVACDGDRYVAQSFALLPRD